MRYAVIIGVLQLNITQCSDCGFDLVGHIRAALRGLAYRPLRRRTTSNLPAKFCAHLREILRKNVVAALAARTINHMNRSIRKANAWIELRERGIIPVLDMPQIDLRQRLAGEPQMRIAEKVVNGNNADDDYRQLG